MFSLTGKVALVTGASRGIGKAIATQLQALGATVVGTATSDNGAEKISEYLGTGNGLVLNVTSDDSIAAMFSAIKEAHGGVDILVNNAGITRDNLFMRMKDDEWQDIIDTNLTSIFKVSKAAIRPMMKKRNGRIINIGSVVGTSSYTWPGDASNGGSSFGVAIKGEADPTSGPLEINVTNWHFFMGNL